MLLLLPAKIIYEMTSGLTIFVNNAHTEMVPVPLSHLVGGISGFLVGFTKLGNHKASVLPALDLHISGTACKKLGRFKSGLSVARAAAVSRALSGMGVSPDYLSAVGYSEYRPIAENDT